MKNLILVDCDGVLCNWEQAFDSWMIEQGYTMTDRGENKYKIDERYGISPHESKNLVKYFNESATIEFLPPLRDSIHYVKKLHEQHGYVFHCITSLSRNRSAQILRERNLKKLFGETVFEDIVCLDTGADKDQALLKYKNSGCYWVEDKLENAEVGLRLGLKSILVSHAHNLDYLGPIPMVDTWSQIYTMITGCKV